MKPDVVDDLRCELGEGPVWDTEHGELLWVDITAGAVHRRPLAGGTRSSVWFKEAVGAVALRDSGGWAVGLASGPALRNENGSFEQRWFFADVDAQAAPVPIRANDGKCDPCGRFWLGTMARDGQPGHGSLYRLDPHHGTFTPQLTGVGISNGLGWSPDGDEMYYVDTATDRLDVMAFDAEQGKLGDRRPVVDFASLSGSPDGLTVDEDGAIWVALWGGGAVHRYTPEGSLDQIIELPCQQVTSCTFVGAALDALAITTATVGLTRPEPLAGATFVADVGTRGRDPDRYRG